MIPPSIVKGLFGLVGKILAVFGVYRAGHRAGSLKAANKSMKHAQKLRKKADEIELEVATTSDATIREWLRDHAKPE